MCVSVCVCVCCSMSRTSLPKPKVVTYGAAVSCCGKEETWFGAWQLLGQMTSSQLQLSIVACGAAVSGCEKAGSWTTALGLITQMDRRSLSSNIISQSALISACQKSARWLCAALLLSGAQVNAVQADRPMQNALIFACARDNQWVGVLSLLDASPNLSLQPNVATCNSVLAAFEGGGWQEASCILARMKSLELKQDVITHTSVSSILEKVVQWRRSLHLLFIQRVSPQGNSESLSLLNMNSVISACSRAENWRMAAWKRLKSARALGLALPHCGVFRVSIVRSQR